MIFFNDKGCSEETIQLLLPGSDPNQQNKDGDTLLMMALRYRGL